MPDDRSSTTAEAQLERILYILAAAQGEEGIALEQLAARLGVDRDTIRDDIAQVTAREFYHPAASVMEMTILLEDDRVSVPLPGEFRRPTRLSLREAAALGLALRARAAEAAPPRRSELLALAEALEEVLAPPPPGHGRGGRPAAAPDAATRARRALVSAIELDPGTGADEGVRLLLERAAAERRPVRIRYLKPGAEPEERLLHPYALVASEGVWYAVGLSPERGAVRLFRLDRILDATPCEGSFEVPADFEPADYLEGGRVYRAHDDVIASVRYSARVAPWIVEQGPAEREADGSVVVRHRVADARWLVRHVLQYAGQAEVLEPAELRAAVARAAAGIAAGDPGGASPGERP